MRCSAIRILLAFYLLCMPKLINAIQKNETKHQVIYEKKSIFGWFKKVGKGIGSFFRKGFNILRYGCCGLHPIYCQNIKEFERRQKQIKVKSAQMDRDWVACKHESFLINDFFTNFQLTVSLVYVNKFAVSRGFVYISLRKKCSFRSFPGPYFPAFGLNTKRYEVSLRIQSECGKENTDQENSKYRHFSRSVY